MAVLVDWIINHQDGIATCLVCPRLPSNKLRTMAIRAMETHARADRHVLGCRDADERDEASDSPDPPAIVIDPPELAVPFDLNDDNYAAGLSQTPTPYTGSDLEPESDSDDLPVLISRLWKQSGRTVLVGPRLDNSDAHLHSEILRKIERGEDLVEMAYDESDDEDEMNDDFADLFPASDSEAESMPSGVFFVSTITIPVP